MLIASCCTTLYGEICEKITLGPHRMCTPSCGLPDNKEPRVSYMRWGCEMLSHLHPAHHLVLAVTTPLKHVRRFCDEHYMNYLIQIQGRSECKPS